jgi:hypothetical protein
MCFSTSYLKLTTTFEVVENIVYENLEDLIDGLKECNVTKD